MRDTNDDVPEVGVGARGGAAQGAGPRQDDGGHRHPRSQLNNILHFALNSLLWNFSPWYQPCWMSGVVSTIGDQRYSSMHQQLNTFGRKVETANTDKEAVTEADTANGHYFLLQIWHHYHLN